MKRFFGCDAHKRYTLFASMNEAGQTGSAIRLQNNRLLFRRFLKELPPRSLIALESVGN